MSGGHSGVATLHGPHDTAAARLDPATKVVCLLAFVLAVVVTPVHAVWAFALYAVLVLAAAVSARLPVATLARRLVIEAPFLLFAVLLPVFGRDPRVEVLGLSLSEPGLWAAFGILAKGTLGAAACITLAWSTPVADLLAGLDRLHLPRALTMIASLMVRYLDVVGGELGRLQVARVSRADDPRWLWQGKAVAATAGTLFIRSFERGERVHQAMLSRGFDGHLPQLGKPAPTAPAPPTWPLVALPALAAAVALLALLMTR